MVMLLRGITKTIPYSIFHIPHSVFHICTGIVQIVAIASDTILKISDVISVSSTLR